MSNNKHRPSLSDLFFILREIRRSLEFLSPIRHKFSTTQCIVVGAFFDLKYQGHNNVTAKMICDVTGIPQSSVYRSINRLIDIRILDSGTRVGTYKVLIDYPKEILKYLKYPEELKEEALKKPELTIGEKELKAFIAETIRSELKGISATISKPISRPKEKVLNSETTDDTLLDDLDDINAILDEEAEQKGFEKKPTSNILDSLKGVFQ